MYIFCEDRKRPITSKEAMSYIKRNNHNFEGIAQPGEIYTFQICLYSEETLSRVDLLFDELTQKESGYTVPADQMTCYNLEGIDESGKSFKKSLSINGYQVLWVGIKLPEEMDKGIYTGQISVLSEEKKIAAIQVKLDIQGSALENNGFNDGWRHSRLEWLNSTIYQDNQLVSGFSKVQVEGRTAKILGRHIHVNESGLVDAIHSYFSEDLSEINDKPLSILREPIVFKCYIEGKVYELKQKGLVEIVQSSSEKVVFQKCMEGDVLDIVHQLTIEYDGYMSLQTIVSPKQNCTVSDIQLRVSYTEEATKYSMGFGHEGGCFTPFDYRWNDDHQDTLWVGNVNGGLSCTLKDDNYERPFVNVYYNQRKRKKPIWDNDGKGRVQLIKETEGGTLLASTGEMSVEKGETKTFIAEFYITPFRCIDYKKHWSTRYFHPHENAKQTDWLNEMDEASCNYLNIHHGQELHPFINYPFVEIEKLKSFIKEAHNRGKKVKLYYTLRELTNHIDELWAFYSLGDEIFPSKNNDEILFWKAKDPSKWLEDNLLSEKRLMWVEENIDEDLIPAWQHVFGHGKYKGEVCASILVNPSSRLNNFYLQGLEWLVKELDIDGIYVDDVAYDRKTMQRVRKILDQKEGTLIDLHSWNHMNENAGQVNCALLYKELLPYVDSLWFGEGFDYNKSPDYWMVEMAGIPFGLTSEMLQNDGHPFRGMVFGMSNRSQWGKRNPKPIHKVWDDFGIEESKMKGYWVSDCPVKVDNDKIKATAYVKDGEVLVAIGSWSERDEVIQLIIDWKALGIEKENAICKKIPIEGLQEEEVISPSSVEIKASLGSIIHLLEL